MYKDPQEPAGNTMGVADRLYRIVKAALDSRKEGIKEKFFTGGDPFRRTEEKSEYYHYKDTSAKRNPDNIHPYPWDPKNDLLNDLRIFGMEKGAGWADVKKRYRDECRKYHSDLYHNDSQKKDAAEEIMVIYNGAYSRLKRYYNKK